MLTGPAPAGAEIWLGGEGFAGGNHLKYQFPYTLLLPKRSECLNFASTVGSQRSISFIWCVSTNFVLGALFWLPTLRHTVRLKRNQT
jgi:hypothetical protein